MKLWFTEICIFAKNWFQVFFSNLRQQKIWFLNHNVSVIRQRGPTGRSSTIARLLWECKKIDQKIVRTAENCTIKLLLDIKDWA